MKSRYLPALLLFLGLIAIQLGVFSPLREIAVVPWAIGFLFFVAAAVAATKGFRQRHKEGRQAD